MSTEKDLLDDMSEAMGSEQALINTPVPSPTLRSVEALTDESTMPFGKYKGQQLKFVPASYLLWWLRQASDHNPELKKYIVVNKAALEEESEHESRKFYTTDDYGYEEDDDWGDRD